MFNVLYVDDESGLLEICKTFLEMSGELRIDTALSAQEAMGLMEAKSYDAVISDFQMPEMNGIELLERIRGRFSDLPFILFTGKGRQEVVIEALNNGADFYIQKGGDPISQFAELEHKVKNAIIGHKTAQALKKSEARFRCLIENAPVAIAILQDGLMTYANPMQRELFGYYRPEEYTGISLCDFLTAPDRGGRPWDQDDPNKGLMSKEVEFLGWRKDGSKFPIELSAAHVNIADSPAVLTFVRDTTERRQVEEELKRMMAQLNLALDMANLASWEFDPESASFIFNDRFYKLYATDAECEGGYRMSAHDYSERFIHPDDRQRVAEIMADICKPEYNKDYLQLEHHIVRRDGEVRYIVVRAMSIVDQDGKRVTGFGVNQDITERKQDEERLQSTMTQLSMAMDMAKLVCWEYEGDTSTFIFNDRFYKLYATDAEREGGYRMASEEYNRRFIHPDDHGKIWRHANEELLPSYPSGYIELEHRMIRRDGEVRHVLVRSTNRKLEDGRLTNGFGVNLDITDIKKAEEEVRKSRQKLDLLNNLTHHDIKNQLLIQSATLELMRRSTTEPKQLENIKRLEGSVDIVQDQIDFMSVYQRMGTALPRWQSIESILRTIQEQRSARSLTIAEGVKGLMVCADPMLSRVFHNLVEDSMLYAGGQVTLTVDCHETEGALVLVYADDGVGIPCADKSKLFTKGFGKGTGLGLFLSREILAITGIEITETGEPGKGARFEMTIPAGRFRFELDLPIKGEGKEGEASKAS